ncbi:hypothetical protein M885DRAFT_612113 [Pelagophyceae sp. CCMP2097]|nr:hypothetical protein M885DRAFT_612113 [Pelagophyceae sp. CCMP2097]
MVFSTSAALSPLTARRRHPWAREPFYPFRRVNVFAPPPVHAQQLQKLVPGTAFVYNNAQRIQDANGDQTLDIGFLVTPTGPGVNGNYHLNQPCSTSYNSRMGRRLCSEGVSCCDADGVAVWRDIDNFTLSTNNLFQLHYLRYAQAGAQGAQPDEQQPAGAEPVNQLDLIYHYSRSNGVCMSANCRLELDWDAGDDSPHQPHLGRINHKLHHGGMLSGSPDDGDNIFGYTLFRSRILGDPTPGLATTVTAAVGAFAKDALTLYFWLYHEKWELLQL